MEWVVEGIIKPLQHRSLESIALECIRTLIDRNLMLPLYRFADGDFKPVCGVHSLIRQLCQRESVKELIIHSPRGQIIIQNKETMCAICGRPRGENEGLNEGLNFSGLALIHPSSFQVSPLMCELCAFNYKESKRLSFVKVMDIVGEYYGEELVHSTKIQEIMVHVSGDLKFISPSFVHLLWRLQSICIFVSDPTTSIVLPSEIWKMARLRNLQVQNAVLTYPFQMDIEGKDFVILKYLHSINLVRNFISTPGVVCRIPNLRLLMISDRDNSWPNCSLCNLADLHILEDLEVDKPIFTLANMSFPETLISLTLRHTRIPWSDITIIGSLPNLKELELDNACIGPDWNPKEGEFPQLRVLKIESTDLLHWGAEAMHFPILKRLILHHILHELEIPSSIGDISALEGIRLYCCSQYVIDSVKQLWDEQQDYGNELQVVVIVDRDGRGYEFGGER